MKTIPLGEAVLRVVDQGVGPALLFLHGFPLDHTMWSRQIEEFSATFRVIAPDLRGFGASDVTPGIVTMHQLADDVATLLDALEIVGPITLCGLSMGGYVAWEFWKRHQHRLGRLILCDTRAAADAPEVAQARRMMANDVIARGATVAAEAMLPKLFAPTTYDQQPDLVEVTRQTILSTSAEAIAATQRGMAERHDITSLLGDIDLPALLLAGQDDEISPPEEMRGIAETMPQAQFVSIASAGHMAPAEQPQAVNDTISQFLQDSSLASSP